jgi:hypothetical protein
MDLTIFLSTDIQNWLDYNAFQLLNSPAQCELIDVSHNHERYTSRSLLLRGLVGCKGSFCAEGSSQSLEALQVRLGFRSHTAPQEPNGFRSKWMNNKGVQKG